MLGGVIMKRQTFLGTFKDYRGDFYYQKRQDGYAAEAGGYQFYIFGATGDYNIAEKSTGLVLSIFASTIREAKVKLDDFSKTELFSKIDKYIDAAKKQIVIDRCIL